MSNNENRENKKERLPIGCFLGIISFIVSIILYFVTTPVEEIIGNIALSIFAIPIYYFIKEIFKHIDFRL